MDFDIHLTLACLREAPLCGAKAGILAFGIGFVEVVVCLFGQLIEAVF